LTHSSSFSRPSRFSECWRHTHTYRHIDAYTLFTHIRTYVRACRLSLPHTQYPRFGSACGRFVRTSDRAASRGNVIPSLCVCVSVHVCISVSLFLASARALDLAGRARKVCPRTRAQAVTRAHTHEHMRVCARVHSCARADSARMGTQKQEEGS